MKKVIMIKIPGCPYCAKARKAISLLQEEDKYKDIKVEEIDETTRVWTTTPLKKR